MIEKLAVIDTETTGLSPERHEVIEIGLVLAEHEQRDDGSWEVRKTGEWEVKLNPWNIEGADPVALRMNHYDPRVWEEEAVAQRDGLIDLSKRLQLMEQPEGVPDSQMLNNMIIVGHNVHFDIQFLQTAFKRIGIEHPLNKRVIDTYPLARGVLRHEHMKNFKLGTLCEYFNIKNKKAHSALADALVTFDLYTALVNYK